MLPLRIPVSAEGTNHIQGIAIDKDRKYVYCSFTTELIKYDMKGNAVGSVKGLVGHLGCIAYNYGDGRVYGSLEYKHDAIGASILRNLGSGAVFEEGFYIAIFDVEKIDRMGMDAERDGVMTAVYMDEVTRDYSAEGHRHGCSGIDGTTFAPLPGEDGKRYLYVAYGIYGDVDREDNDYQVILVFDPSELDAFARPLCQTDMHREGPAYMHKYFVRTGNTNYGVQNLEYDPFTNRMFMAVYRGKKPSFPNYTTFAVDMSVKASVKPLAGKGISGEALSLAPDGEHDEKSGVYGWYFNVGSTGIASLRDGYYYFSHNREDYPNKRFYSDIHLYKWDGTTPFRRIEEKEGETI